MTTPSVATSDARASSPGASEGGGPLTLDFDGWTVFIDPRERSGAVVVMDSSPRIRITMICNGDGAHTYASVGSCAPVGRYRTDDVPALLRSALHGAPPALMAILGVSS